MKYLYFLVLLTACSKTYTAHSQIEPVGCFYCEMAPADSLWDGYFMDYIEMPPMFRTPFFVAGEPEPFVLIDLPAWHRISRLVETDSTYVLDDLLDHYSPIHQITSILDEIYFSTPGDQIYRYDWMNDELTLSQDHADNIHGNSNDSLYLYNTSFSYSNLFNGLFHGSTMIVDNGIIIDSLNFYPQEPWPTGTIAPGVGQRMTWLDPFARKFCYLSGPECRLYDNGDTTTVVNYVDEFGINALELNGQTCLSGGYSESLGEHFVLLSCRYNGIYLTKLESNETFKLFDYVNSIYIVDMVYSEEEDVIYFVRSSTQPEPTLSLETTYRALGKMHLGSWDLEILDVDF